MMNENNIKWHEGKVTKQHRNALNRHKSATLWFTGLSGSGKSTISVELEKSLYEMGIRTYRLDGDNIRHGLNSDLDFSDKDRKENIRRIGEVSKLMIDAGLITLTAFISPFKKDRHYVRSLMDDGEFIEVYVYASIEACEERDPKGLYKKVKEGKIKGFTGIDSPYEEPDSPEIHIDTESLTIDESVEKILTYLRYNQYL
ncbi:MULTISPECIES: adenylyl-sulfate kinase [Bacillaceae]|uniref:adenylyl-sulfate kinase n=1 Tax=Bacillaceae TaxID=186817 RepID=UPI001C575E5B|nr:adenylyl-sulfate kinase [Rossellomorea sp. YZS02]MBW3113785.1 adenylyl-sulfate kinase [Bacillus sp. MCCB 382]MDX8343972.1 adenylyl-sulfate kinase [Rossellomorea sp. YZS02]